MADTPRRPRRPRNGLVAVEEASAAAVAAERENTLARQAYDLRQQGWDWFDIAEKLQVPEAQAKRLLSEKIKQAAELFDAGAKTDLLLLEVSRLDRLQRVLWERLDLVLLGEDASTNTIVTLVNAILGIVRDRAKLFGLDAAALTVNVEQVNTVVVPGKSDEYVAALRQLAERTYPGQVVYEPDQKGA